MKKNILVLAALSAFFCVNLFAESAAEVETDKTSVDEEISFYLDDMCFYRMVIQKDKIIEYSDEENIIKEAYPSEALKLNDNGYYYFTDENGEKRILVFGNNFFGFFVNENNPFSIPVSGYEEMCESNGWYYKYVRRNSPEVTFTASSQLKENTTLYEASNLKKLFFPSDCIDSLMPFWNRNHKPWVEAAEGNGEGEYIELKADKNFSSLLLLNGYVNFNRLDLFKKNSRVKTFKVEDLDNHLTSEICLKDAVIFERFTLEKPTTHLRLTIKEVYPGSKWQDTCFSSIIAY